MLNKIKGIIPEHFNSAEEAGEFWDSHSAADYWNEMEEEEIEFDIRKRTFLVPVDGSDLPACEGASRGET